MPAKKPVRTASNPTPEQMQQCISILQTLRPKFEQLKLQQQIEDAEIKSLTHRFSSTMVDLYGAGTFKSEHYEDWQPYSFFSYNSNTPQHVFDAMVQDSYREGITRTITELDNVLEHLELLLGHAGVTKMTPSAEIDLVLQLCKRLDKSAKVLSRRGHKKQPFTIDDEYDVQDLLQAILRAYFKFSVTEEPISKLAGLSSRADFAIEELGLVIEAKYVHGQNDQERVVKQFAEDLQGYSQWPHLEHFIYLIYGADDLKDPEALDKLEGPKSYNDKRFKAYVVRCA